jgi:hypothetical protein
MAPRVTPLTVSAYAPWVWGSTTRVRHQIARRQILRRLPLSAPRSMVLMLLSTPIARPVLRRAYDRYMQSRTHPKYARTMPSVH